MPIPNLDDWTDTLDERCRDYLGETIQYAADGVTYAAVKAHVDYRDAQGTLDRSEVVRQDIMVTVLMSDVPVKPPRSARVTLAKRAGRVFAPASPRRDESGTHWEFDLEDVTDA